MITFYADMSNGNLPGVAAFLGSPAVSTIDFSDLNFKTALEAAIANQHTAIVHLIIALPSFRQSLTANDFNYISMAILSHQPQLVEELLAIPTLYAQREKFDTTHTLEFLFRDILNAGYIMDGTKTQQRPQLSTQHQQRALLAFAGLKTALRWTTPQALNSACEGKDLPFAKLTLITNSQDLWTLMPLPEPTDCKQYQQVYYAMDAIVRNKKLAHRMEIDGDASVLLLSDQTLAYSYHGSTVQPMLREMQASFDHFIENRREIFETILNDNHLPLSLLENVVEDIAHIGETFNGALYIPVHIEAKEPHVIAVGFFLDLCLIADRGNLAHHGARIFRVPENLPVSLEEAVMALTNPGEVLMSSDEQLLTFLKDKLTISEEPIDTVPFAPQFSGNCAWSSFAKMMPVAAFYFRAYQAVLTINQDEIKAQTVAHQVAKACYRAWSCEDQVTHLKNYLAYYQRPECSPYGPDPLLLAKIYLSTKDKKPYQRQLKQLLEQSGILTPTLLEQGREALLVNAKNNLHKFYAKLGIALPAWLSNDLSRQLCSLLVNIYLKENKMKTIEACQTFMTHAAQVTDPIQGLALITELQQRYFPEDPYLPAEGTSKGWLPSQGAVLKNDRNVPLLNAEDPDALYLNRTLHPH